jgi:DNA-binding transcriptional MerR regulator
MSRTELARYVGCSRTTIWNFEKRGVIAPPRRVSGNRSIFDEAAIMAAEAAVLAGKAVA